MLVLSRKPGERILIGDDVTVTIVRIGPNHVRVGIEAPQSTTIIRDELLICDTAVDSAPLQPLAETGADA